jgi:hypothetical protein
MPPKTSAPATEEPKGTLSPGDPEASYVSPDLSTQDGTGTLPDAEKDWHDTRDGDHDAEVEAAADNEDAVVKRRAEEAEKAEKAQADATATPTTTKATSSTPSGSSSS